MLWEMNMELNSNEQRDMIIDYLITKRDELISKGLEPVIDEMLMELDPTNKWNWNTMYDKDANYDESRDHYEVEDE